jgi:DNA-directed RNA polymerase specialized sigma24 family protein
MSEHSEAWGWVLQHAQVVKCAAWRMASGTGLDADDLHSALLVRLVERWHVFDNTVAKPSTWVWWQARAVRSAMIDQRRRRMQEDELVDASHPVVAPTAEAWVLAAQARKIAEPDEWQAALAYAEGLVGEELGQACGCAPFSARRRVARLRARMEGAA